MSRFSPANVTVVFLLGGPGSGSPAETGFTITAASEIMAILGLATDLDDLKTRLARITVGLTFDKKPVTAGDLKAEGAADKATAQVKQGLDAVADKAEDAAQAVTEKAEDETGAETIEIILGVIGAAALAAAIWAGINAYGQGKLGELG